MYPAIACSGRGSQCCVGTLSLGTTGTTERPDSNISTHRLGNQGLPRLYLVKSDQKHPTELSSCPVWLCKPRICTCSFCSHGILYKLVSQQEREEPRAGDTANRPPGRVQPAPMSLPQVAGTSIARLVQSWGPGLLLQVPEHLGCSLLSQGHQQGARSEVRRLEFKLNPNGMSALKSVGCPR